ncbi:hypothetical protein A3728_07420 [Sulfitobacter sp. HI0040]|nr:hypothetical protein A3728_07420 [Sulfitobacter sp. HI0040]
MKRIGAYRRVIKKFDQVPAKSLDVDYGYVRRVAPKRGDGIPMRTEPYFCCGLSPGLEGFFLVWGFGEVAMTHTLVCRSNRHHAGSDTMLSPQPPRRLPLFDSDVANADFRPSAAH